MTGWLPHKRPLKKSMGRNLRMDRSQHNLRAARNCRNIYQL